MANTSISPDYFWYQMSYGELTGLLNSIEKKNKERWELMRCSAFHLIQPHINSKNIKTFTPESFIPFPWDKEGSIKKKKVYSKEDKEEIIKRLSNVKATDKVATF